METKANYTLIGIFTLAVLISAFGFVYWFSRAGEGKERTTYGILFEGPVSGLRVGAGVHFNGIRVGEVMELRLDRLDPRKVFARVEVDNNTPVRADTRVTLEYQGLTGIAAVSMRGGAPGSPGLAAPEGEVPLLFADPSGLQDLLDTARQIMGRVDSFLENNEKPLTQVVQNIAKFSERLDGAMTSLESLLGSANTKGTFAEITDAARSVRILADNLDKRTAEITAGISHFTGPGLRELQALAGDGRRTLMEVERAVKSFEKSPQRLIYGGGTKVPEYR